MTKEEANLYKDYPEGSGGKNIYDLFYLPFAEYLEKYYSDPEFKEWNRWYPKYIEPAFDTERHDEMIKNFGYASKEMHDFDAQYKVYNDLKLNDKVSEEIKMFVGFMAGANFFKRFNLTVDQWFDMKNWHNPNVDSPDGTTINDLLNIPFGMNYFKVLLTQMPFWRR